MNQQQIAELKERVGYSGKSQQWQYCFDLACCELQAQLEEDKWMSVKDWLPASGVPVLIHAPNLRVPFLVGVRDVADLGHWYFPDEGNFLKMEYAGNWQPLPKPPKELTK